MVLLGCNFNGKPRLVYLRMNRIRLSLGLLNQCPIYQKSRNRALTTDEIMSKLQQYSVERRIEELKFDQEWGSKQSFTIAHFQKLKRATANFINYDAEAYPMRFLGESIASAFDKFKADEGKSFEEYQIISGDVKSNNTECISSDWLVDWAEFISIIGELDKLIDPIDLHLLEDYPYVDRKQSPIMEINNDGYKISLKVFSL